MSEVLERIKTLLGLHNPRRVLGLAFILAVAVIWVLASFVVQGIEAKGVHPIVLTYIANSLFAIYLPIYYLNLRLRAGRGVPSRQELQRFFSSDQPLSDGSTTPIEAPVVPQTSLQQLFKAACVVAPLWFLAQLTFNASLRLTSVTSNTILSSASALFTFLFAVALLSERFTLFKLGCIGLLMAGTAMVTLADATSSPGEGGGGGDSGEGSPEHGVLGDMLCLLSSVVYGAYTVAIRRMLGDEDEGVSMTMFFGMMGGLIFCIMGPMLGVLRLLGFTFGTLTWPTFWMVVAKGLLDNVLSDYLWARAILLVGPTLATSGLSLQVPIAVTLDAIFRHPRWLYAAGPAILTFLGGGVVLAGFFGINTAEEVSEDGGDQAEAQENLRKVWERQAASLQAEFGGHEGEEDEDDGGLSVGGGNSGWSGGGGGERYSVRTQGSLPP